MEDKKIIDQLLKDWDPRIQQTTKFFDGLSGWALQQEIVPGGNTVHYIIGHLLVVNDRLLEAMTWSSETHRA